LKILIFSTLKKLQNRVGVSRFRAFDRVEMKEKEQLFDGFCLRLHHNRYFFMM